MLMVTCPKKQSLFHDSASFGTDGRAHYFSRTLTSEESPSMKGGPLQERLTRHNETVRETGGRSGVEYNFPKKKRHVEFGPTRGVTDCILSIQAGVRSK